MGKPWPKEQVKYLEAAWGRTSLPTIAKNIDRSVNAVRLKARRIGLGRHLHSGDMITLNQLAKAAGKDYSAIREIWIPNGLPFQYIKSIKRRYKVIDIDNFWEWAKEHRNLIDFSKVEENILGKEPYWVKEQRKADFLARKYKKSAWAPEEEVMLIQLLNTYRYGYREISQRLNRTEAAIKRRMYDLGIKQRPIRADNHTPWTDEEVDILLDMKEKGYSYEIIAEKIGRSALAVRGKVERMELEVGAS